MGFLIGLISLIKTPNFEFLWVLMLFFRYDWPIKPQNFCPRLVKSSQSNFYLQSPDCYWVRSYLITTVTSFSSLTYIPSMFAPNWKRLQAKVRCKYRCPRGLSSGWELRPDWPSEHLQLLPSHQFLQFGSYTLEWIAATSVYPPHQQDFWLKHSGRFVRFLFWSSNKIIKRERKLVLFVKIWLLI